MLTVRPEHLKDTRTRTLVESILNSHGFKWNYREGTDLCSPEDIHVSIKRDGTTITITYDYEKNKKYVLSKSIGEISKIVVPRDLKQMYSMVYVKTPEKHFPKP